MRSLLMLATLGLLTACGAKGAEGDPCEVDDDCEEGLVCHEHDDGDAVCEHEDEHDHDDDDDDHDDTDAE